MGSEAAGLKKCSNVTSTTTQSYLTGAFLLHVDSSTVCRGKRGGAAIGDTFRSYLATKKLSFYKLTNRRMSDKVSFNKLQNG